MCLLPMRSLIKYLHILVGVKLGFVVGEQRPNSTWTSLPLLMRAVYVQCALCAYNVRFKWVYRRCSQIIYVQIDKVVLIADEDIYYTSEVA